MIRSLFQPKLRQYVYPFNNLSIPAKGIMNDTNGLLKLALDARGNAHAPYSEFKVGAALLTSSGAIYTGCNVENASYGLAICAERVAICKAVSEGERSFQKIAVVATPFATPCGACRQFIVEFGKSIEVVCADAADLQHCQSWTIDELIPDSFHF